MAAEWSRNGMWWFTLLAGFSFVLTMTALVATVIGGVMSVLIYRRLGLIQRSLAPRAEGIGIAVAGSPAIRAQSERNPQAEAEWSAAMAMLGKSRETDPDRRFMPKG